MFWDDESGLFLFSPYRKYRKLLQEATVDYQEGRLADAEKKLLEMLGYNNRLPNIHYNLGIIHRDMSKYDLSIKHFRKAIDLKPKDAAIYCELATSLFHSGKKEEAKSNLEKTIEIDPSYALGHANLGVWYLRQEPSSVTHEEFIDSLEKAKQCFEEALGWDPECSTAKDGLRQTRARLNIFKSPIDDKNG